jgi:hypothetical protein
MSKIVRINNGDYDLYVTPNGTITFHDKVVVGDPETGVGDLIVGNNATIYNNLTIINGELTAGSANITNITARRATIDTLIGDPVNVQHSLRFLNTDPTTDPVNNKAGILVYGKAGSDSLWYVDCSNKVHSIADSRKALAYSLIF